jgi:hypothetical protein
MEIMNTMFKGISNTLSPPNKEVQVEHDEAFWSMLMAQMMPMTQPSPDIQPMIVQEQSESVLSITPEGNNKINPQFIEPSTMPLLFQTLSPSHEYQTVIQTTQPIEVNLNPVNLDVNIQFSHQGSGQVRLSEVQPLEHQTRPISSDMLISLNQSESVLSSFKELEVKPELEHKVIQEKSVMNIPVEIQLQEETKPSQDFRNVISKMMVEKSMTHSDVSSIAVTPSEFEKQLVQSETRDPSQVVDTKMVQLEPNVQNQTSEIKTVDIRSLNELELNQTIKQMIQTDKKEMIIKLKPEGIGEIVIKLSSDNKVDIKFNVINAEVLNSLEKQLPHLHVSLKDYNVMIETSLNFNHQQKEHQREHSSAKHHHSILNHDVEKSVVKQPTLSNRNAINRYA